MGMATVITVLRCLAPFVGVAILPWTLWQLSRPAPARLGRYHVKAIAMELVATPAEFERITDGEHAATRRALDQDTFVIIPVYALLFLGLALWLARLRLPAMLYLGLVIALCVLVAGAADVLENRGIAAALDRADQPAVDRIRHAAHVKWACFVVLTALLSVPFLRHGGWPTVVGLLYVVTAVTLAAGLRHGPLMEWGFAAMGAALLLTGEAVRVVSATNG